MKYKNPNGVRRMIAVLCMLGILFLLQQTALTVNAQGDAKLTVSAVTAENKSTAEVTVTLEGNPGIWGIKFKVGYDHSALTLQSVANGNVFEASDVVLPDRLDREQFVFVAASNKLEDITENGVITTLSFLVNDGAAAGAYPITLDLIQTINDAGEDAGKDVSITATAGSITVKAVEAGSTGDSNKSGSEEQKASQKTTGNGAGDENIAASGSIAVEAGIPNDLNEEQKAGQKTTGTKTGDDSNPVLWIVLIVAALTGGGVCYVLHIRRERGRYRDRRDH